MGRSIEDKMYQVAEYLNELNDRGQVKGFSGNERGYAKVKEIKRGCAIWVHHLNDDRLIIDLMVSVTAAEKFPEITSEAISKFKDFFNYMFEKESWKHSVNENNAERYYVEVSELQTEEIEKILSKIRSEFSR